MDNLSLLLVFEFDSGQTTKQAGFEDMRGIPTPMIGDSVCPGEGKFKVVSRTFNYHDDCLTIYYFCKKEKE